MNAYLFSNIQSAAYGNLFECSTHEENGRDIVFSSMSHENEVGVMDDGEELLLTSLLNTEGLKEKFMISRTIFLFWGRYFMLPPRFRLTRRLYCRRGPCASRRSGLG